MLVEIDANGMINHARVRSARSPEIERGRRTGAITGIVVHQTDADTSASSLNSYKRPKANGAHFLIDTDGTIYQTAAIYQRTNHVGPLKARCLVMRTCKLRDFPEKVGATAMHRIEMRKAPGDRYPSNMEAIGIEMVGRARLPEGFKPETRHRNLSPEELRGEAGIFPSPTAAQNQSLSWLVDVLQDSMQIAPGEIFRHPDASRKNPTEAQGANWNLSLPTP
ncbi:N-acetylmuramoyl-L-alanine amidase [Variovorax sp. Varisp85]|uniref:peptidoglycan recognition protein family protein n=1 Tax=unclassified Variovorax TaxID=663243 RepID=UPI000270E4FB|nr:N-acetylmuramoyl-L-alanine amidase [Variovorax sp. CF313]EJL67385.1 negative regulator of beta-lactamase expression [Variovorax sp. CF313]